ncbi:MAG: family 16 glycosylhydrolase [Pseudomonadota bacterium]
MLIALTIMIFSPEAAAATDGELRALDACKGAGAGVATGACPTTKLDPMALLPADKANFSGPTASPAARSAWQVADYTFSHSFFDTDWRKANAVFRAEDVSLRLTPRPDAIPGENRFYGASIRTRVPTGFGRYEALIQAGRGPGVVTGFFTYTGSAYGTRHDEIDIEFLGRDTTRIHVAWFVDGSLKSRFIDLGFDAADQPRRYAFEWHPSHIAWFVEGREVFRATEDVDGPLPQVPSLLFANIWAADPSISDWSGTIVPGTRAEARVSQIRFTAFAAQQPDQADATEMIGTKVSAAPP